MTRIIAIANQKGGVGKTTTSVNLSASLAATKRRILLIDLDPQGNATAGSGIDKKSVEASINEVLLGEIAASEAVIETEWGYDVLPSNGSLTIAEVRLLKMEQREQCLKKALNTIMHSYDYILIDCPPSLNMLTVNALVAADGVLVPIQCEYYALEGLTSLLGNIDKIRKAVNPELQIEGLVRTMYDGRNRLTKEVSEQLLAHFENKVYHTVIPRNVRLAEAPSHGIPIIAYEKGSQGAASYLALAGELLRRHEQAQQEKQEKQTHHDTESTQGVNQ
ncbi:MAG: AAA family ATPase [Gammaproteobacteria bacterium]|nr:AAA family ATPase [Gammaproteobacteria bacterium]MCH9744293.1 AAA family ATPase [Gammaproteobacteria bacterium]